MKLASRSVAAVAAVAALLVLGAPAASASTAEWAPYALRVARPWLGLQNDSGELVDYMDEYTNPTGKPGGTRYGDALMGYALVETGLRAGDVDLVDTGIRSISWATDPNRYFAPNSRSDASVFEQWGVAAAYNLLRQLWPTEPLFEQYRDRWETWLRSQKTVRFGTGRRFSNHDLVEALMALELLRSGLTSDDPTTIVGGERASTKQHILDLVNDVVPSVIGSSNPAFMSDPPDMPAAYHALSFGLYAHLVSKLGDEATLRAHIVVRRAADGSWRMAAPDADQGLWGRSQELVWIYPAAAYGASVAAGLDDTSAADAARYRALAERSLLRLRALYPITDKGQLIAPGMARDRIDSANVLEGYTGAPSMGGLALAFLNQALDEPVAELDGRQGQLAADRDTEAVIGNDVGSFGVARRGNVWYAVRASRIRAGRLGTDVRYDLGLVGLKRLDGGKWRDVMTQRPNTMGEPQPDSIGPVRVSGRRLYPAAPSTVQQVGDGGFLLRGGFWVDKARKARSANFRFDPTACGVAMTFPGAKGEVYEMSYFFRTPPVKRGRALVARRERVTASVPFGYRVESQSWRNRPYASSMWAPLYRVRVRLRVPASRRIRLESC